MKRISQWAKGKATGFMAVVIGLLFIESLAMALGENHAVQPPTTKLARLFWVSESARVPIIIGFAIILSPITLGYKIKERFFKKQEKQSIRM